MKKRIIFISQTANVNNLYSDASTRYRCYNPADALRKKGYTTAVTSQHDFGDGSKYEDIFDYFVFHRPCLTPELAFFLEKNKRSNKIIADYDDLIFDVSKSALTPAYRFRGVPLRQISQYISANAAANRYFKNFIFSTEPLARRAEELFGDINSFVISNSLGDGYLARAEAIRKRSEPRPFKLGYFSGTATHDYDLEFISESILHKLQDEDDANMLILGPARIPDILLPFRDKIHHRNNLVHFTRLPYEMSQVEVVVAPLEWNDFTICKSGLKFFEAALVGCSVIATPIPDIERFDTKMLTKCKSSDEWMEALIACENLSMNDIEQEVSAFSPLIKSSLTSSVYEDIIENDK